MAGKHGGGGHERWLITYADMLTLLLAFFVIMYSISKADAQRFQKFQQGMQQAFHLGILEGSTAVTTQDSAGAPLGVDTSTGMGPVTLPAAQAPVPLTSVAGPVVQVTPVIMELKPDVTVTGTAVRPAHAVQPIQTVRPSQTVQRIQTARPVQTPQPTEIATSSPGPAPNDVETAQRLQTVLSGMVASDSNGGVTVQLRSEGIVITMYGVLLFDSGDADIQPQAKPALTEIANDVAGLPYDIRVEGNTDSIQPDGGPYPSNWELSTARALSVLHFLVDSGHLAPSRLSATGYAEFNPVATNSTREGRSRNRRVDLVLVHPLATPQVTLQPTPTITSTEGIP